MNRFLLRKTHRNWIDSLLKISTGVKEKTVDVFHHYSSMSRGANMRFFRGGECSFILKSVGFQRFDFSLSSGKINDISTKHLVVLVNVINLLQINNLFCVTKTAVKESQI